MRSTPLRIINKEVCMEITLHPVMVRELGYLVASIAALITAINAMRKPR